MSDHEQGLSILKEAQLVLKMNLYKGPLDHGCLLLFWQELSPKRHPNYTAYLVGRLLPHPELKMEGLQTWGTPKLSAT